jgi:hypothetical protein
LRESRWRQRTLRELAATQGARRHSDPAAAAACEQIAFDFGKPELDLVEPRRIGRREMDDSPRKHEKNQIVRFRDFALSWLTRALSMDWRRPEERYLDEPLL